MTNRVINPKTMPKAHGTFKKYNNVLGEREVSSITWSIILLVAFFLFMASKVPFVGALVFILMAAGLVGLFVYMLRAKVSRYDPSDYEAPARRPYAAGPRTSKGRGAAAAAGVGLGIAATAVAADYALQDDHSQTYGFDDDDMFANAGPIMNIDGTPMCGGIDINGNPYGVTDHHWESGSGIGMDMDMGNSSMDMGGGFDDGFSSMGSGMGSDF